MTTIHRRIKSRPVKARLINGMRLLGLRHLAIRMDTTNLCNLRCRMCYYSADSNRKRRDMSMELFEKIAADVFSKVRFLYLSCATEPLMNKRFADFVAATGPYKIPFTSFCTNGQLLTEAVVSACIESRFSEIIFSVDGATPDTYEFVRRGGKWDRLVEKLDLLASMKDKAGSELPVGRMNFTCLQKNIHELPAMVRFADDHGIHNLHVRHLLSYTDEEDSCAGEMAYRKSFNAVAEETRQEAERLGVRLFLPDPVPERAAASGKTCVTDPRKVEANQYCILPWAQGIINWDGEYRICSAHGSFGNFREQTFAEIYNSPKMREVRNKLIRRPPDACSWDCTQEAYDVEEPEQEEDDLVSIDG